MKKVVTVSVLAAALGIAALATAQAPRPKSMLVLDASGSMWGQIGGKAKIAIARDAVGSMLNDWQGGDLGLMAYGHNRKGDCNDIQVLQPVGAADANAIRRQVNAINPKGMTPISAAVRQAAEQLRFTEQKATVILVSDGEETCNADPCALGKELEAMGVDFTAHVIGFDIARGSKADQQLQCLASNTGGRYLQASDAASLNRALGEVAQAAPVAPPAQVCSQYMSGPEFALNKGTWSTGDVAPTGLRKAHFPGLDMPQNATARDCQALCTSEKDCTAWFFEAIGSNFRKTPVCHRWDGQTALWELKDDHPGNAVGVRAGVRQLLSKGGEVCEAATPAQVAAANGGQNGSQRQNGTVVQEKVERQAQRQQDRAENAVDRATDRTVDKVTDKVLNRLFGR